MTPEQETARAEYFAAHGYDPTTATKPADSPCGDCRHSESVHGHFGECAEYVHDGTPFVKRCPCPGWISEEEGADASR